MTRPHIEFIQAYDVAPHPVVGEGLDGASRRMLSQDDEDGSYTALLSLAPGFTSDLASIERPLELFLLTGSARVEGLAFTPGCYVYIPAGRSHARLEVESASDLLFMVEPPIEPEPDANEELVIRDVNAMGWEPVRNHLGERAERAEGIVVKILRIKPGGSDWTWVCSNSADWRAGYAEVHPTVEECFTLRGDCLLGERGVLEPGSYFYRPPMVPHGPMYTRNGTFFFFRTRGGGLKTDYVAVPDWEKLVDEYQQSVPFFQPPAVAAGRA